jgi:hypothetical protein
VRLTEPLEALARAEGQSLNETVTLALRRISRPCDQQPDTERP